MRWLLLRFIRAYQRGPSPALPPACKYQPTCSEYGYEAIQRLGVIRGLPLTAWRLMRCNPFSRGGYDPVPGTRTSDAPAHS